MFEPQETWHSFLHNFIMLVLLESVHSILDIEKEDFKSGERFSNQNQPISISFENVSFAYENAKTY